MMERAAAMTKTVIVREYPDARWRDADVRSMLAAGWQIRSLTPVAGQFRGGRACVLFVIFPPLAFLAGHTPERWTVTYEKPGRDRAALRPARPSAPRRPVGLPFGRRGRSS